MNPVETPGVRAQSGTLAVSTGKSDHHAATVAIVERAQWSVRVSNDQQAVTEVISRISADDEVVWAVDLVRCEPGRWCHARHQGPQPGQHIGHRPHA